MEVLALVLHGDKLVLAHVEVGVLDLAFEEGKRDDLAVKRRRDHQVGGVERDALHGGVRLENLPFEQLFEVDGVQDGDDSRVEPHHNVAVVVRPILQRRHFALARLEDVDRAGLLARSVVNHHVRAPLAVHTREQQLLWNYFLI